MKKSRVIALIAIILIIVAIIIVTLTIKNVNTSIIENHQFYQYFGGQKVNYEGTIVLESKNQISEITSNDEKIQLDSTPMYYVDIPDKVLFPQNMAVVYPISGGLMYKINRFSNLKVEAGGIYIERETKDKSLENVFIYDGSDLYFFLENVTVVVEDDEYEISPLSYVIVEYNGGVEIYNKEKDEYKVIDGNYKNVLAKAEGYTINMSIDAIEYGEKQQLLIKKVEYLDNLE